MTLPSDICVELAYAGLSMYMPTKMATTIANFVKRGTAIPFLCTVEGEMGVGKTTFAIFSAYASISILSILTFNADYLVRFSPKYRIVANARISEEELKNFNPELYEACSALYNGDVNYVVEYVKKNVVFGPFELVSRLREVVREGRIVPFLIADDAGVFFLRTGWIAYGKSWRLAVVRVLSLLQLIRSLTACLIATTPREKELLSRVKDLVDHVAVVKRERDRGTIVRLNTKVYVTDRFVRYYKRVRVEVAGQLGEKTIPISKDDEPILIIYKDKLIEPVMEKVNAVRKELIQRFTAEAEELLSKEAESTKFRNKKMGRKKDVLDEFAEEIETWIEDGE